MTRQNVIDRITDVLLREGFAGASVQLPATADDVTGLAVQLFQCTDAIVEELDRTEEVGYGHGV